MKPMLSADAQHWKRLWSMRLTIATTLYTTAAGAWAVLPDAWRPELSHLEKIVLAGIGVLLPGSAAVSRVLKQPNLTPPEEPK